MYIQRKSRTTLAAVERVDRLWRWDVRPDIDMCTVEGSVRLGVIDSALALSPDNDECTVSSLKKSIPCFLPPAPD